MLLASCWYITFLRHRFLYCQRGIPFIFDLENVFSFSFFPFVELFVRACKNTHNKGEHTYNMYYILFASSFSELLQYYSRWAKWNCRFHILPLKTLKWVKRLADPQYFIAYSQRFYYYFFLSKMRPTRFETAFANMTFKFIAMIDANNHFEYFTRLNTLKVLLSRPRSLFVKGQYHGNV